MSDLVETSPDRSFLIAPGFAGSAASNLFPNLESFSGQLLYTPPLASKNSEVKTARREIVRQARQAERASEPIRGSIDRNADMVVGMTLRVHPQPDWETLGITDKEQRKALVAAMRREFNNWAYDARLHCDAEGHYNFPGMMWMAFRNLAGPDAETCLIVHYDEKRRVRLGGRWATYITVVDPERIETPAEYAADENVFEGRRLDQDGRMVGIYIRKHDPATSWKGDLSDYEFVPRETQFGRPMAIHWFIKTRGMQHRGMSALATVLKQVTMLRKFDESYLASAVINSQLATYIKTNSSSKLAAERLAPGPEGSVLTGGMTFGDKLAYYKEAKFKVGPARIPVLPSDDEIVMTAVNRAIEDPGPFRHGNLREFASATGNSFEQTSLNYSETNYSGARAGELQVWRGVMRVRTMFTTHASTPVYGAVIEEAIERGRIVLPPGAPPFQEYRTAYIAAAWTGPGMSWIDPQKEANAFEKLINLGITNRTRVAAERGDDYFEIAAETAAEIEACEELDIPHAPLMPGQVDPNAEAEAAGDDGDAKPPTKRKGKGSSPTRDGDGDGNVNEREQ